MFGLVFQIAIGFVVAVLVASAVFFLIIPLFLKRASQVPFLPGGLLRAIAIVELFAAACLAIPETRIWGIITTAGVTLAATVVLLTNNKLIWSVPVLMALAALVPVALAR